MTQQAMSRIYALVAVLSLLLVQCNVVMQLRYPSLRSLMDFTGYGEPRWSPDGTRIAFYSPYRGILIMNSDGTQMRSLKETAGQGVTPDWSPDGKRIVFASQRSVRWQLYVIDVEDGNMVQLTDLPRASCPRWSPDGSRIAFCYSTDKEEEGGIYLMNADGTNVTRLVGYPLKYAMPWEWSPDSTMLAFTATSEVATKEGQTPPANGEEYLYVINADGSNLRRLNKGIPGVYLPTWSPNGKQILTSIEGKPMWGGFYLIDLDGSEGRKVFEPSRCNSLQWSWATNRLLYVSYTGNQTTGLFTVGMKDVLK